MLIGKALESFVYVNIDVIRAEALLSASVKPLYTIRPSHT
jgi:hypothetical protein